TTMELNSIKSNLRCHFRKLKFNSRSEDVRAIPMIVFVANSVEHTSHSFCFRIHFSNHFLDKLEVSKVLSKLLTFSGVLNTLIQTSLSNTERNSGNRNSFDF